MNEMELIRIKDFARKIKISETSVNVKLMKRNHLMLNSRKHGSQVLMSMLHSCKFMIVFNDSFPYRNKY